MNQGIGCKLCILAKGLKADEFFQTEEEMFRHLERDHGIPVRRENENDEECQARFKREYPAAVIDDEMKQDRVTWLTEKIFENIMENMNAGPVSRFRVWESLNALAISAATVLNGTDDPRAHQFFQDALSKMRVKIDAVRTTNPISVEVKSPAP